MAEPTVTNSAPTSTVPLFTNATPGATVPRYVPTDLQDVSGGLFAHVQVVGLAGTAAQPVPSQPSTTTSTGVTLPPHTAEFRIDTGSFATVLPLSMVAAAIPGFQAQDYPAGSLRYSSDELTETGVWVPLTLAFPDARLADGSVPTTTVTALVNTEREAFMLGVGVGFDVERGAASTTGHVLTSADNALLGLEPMATGSMAHGYAITREGIVLGATASAAEDGWVTQQLRPGAPAASPGAAPDWLLAQVTASLDGVAHGSFDLLVDTGLNSMFFEFEGGSQVVTGPAGHNVAIDLAGTAAGSAGYSFDTRGDSSQEPSGITFENPRLGTSFINTGANLLSGFDYLYDADAGVVGLRPNGAGQDVTIDFVPPATIAGSGYLDAGSWRLADPEADSVADALQLSGVHQAHAGDTVVMAIAVERANDPSALLALPWAERQQALAELQASGTLWSTFGGKAEDLAALKATLDDYGTLLTAAEGHVDSDTRTVWVSLTASSFAELFGQTLMSGTNARDQVVHYWEGELSAARIGVPVAGLWYQGLATPSTASPQPGTEAVPLSPGPQSPGNAAASVTRLFPDDIAALYDFPLQSGSALGATPGIGILAPGIGAAVGSSDIQSLIDQYRAAAGVTGAGQVRGGTIETPPQTTTGGERSLDLGIVSTVAPDSDIVLYAGAGSVFSAMQEAIWDTDNRIGILSASYSVGQQAAPGSVFQAAYSELAIDAALRNITIVNSSGDGGSGQQYGNGIPMVSTAPASPHVLMVGGTSLASTASAATDPTLSGLLALALGQDRATLHALVAGGLKVMPVAQDTAPLVETVWNQYAYRFGAIGYPLNEASAGGIDPTRAQPIYQTNFGLDLVGAGPRADQGRGLPDVSALAGGDTSYIVPAPDLTFDPENPTTSGGTSASTPLWAALLAQIDAIFAAQGLPRIGYGNDLLYQAAAVAPGAFNDIRIGNNVSTYTTGGDGSVEGVFPDRSTNTVFEAPITPTGLGYAAEPGFDLATGLGTPNGLLLARALVAIAHTQMDPALPGVLDAAGTRSAVTQTLLVQAHGRGGQMIDVGGAVFSLASGSDAAEPYAWSAAFAQKTLQADFDPALVRLFDAASHATPHELLALQGESLGVTIDGSAAAATRAALTSDFGFVDHATGGSGLVLARPVAVAQTALGLDDQEAIVRIRRNTSNTGDSIQFYRVDDLAGTIGGIAPGDAGYAAAASARSYRTTEGDLSVTVADWGGYREARLADVDAGDLIAMRLSDGEHSYWAFSAGNEVAAGMPVTHLWSYGLNTWGWEDTFGGGDRDYNDLVVQIDFTSGAGSQIA